MVQIYNKITTNKQKYRKNKKRKEAQLIELHLFSYGCLSLFIDNYFTPSESTPFVSSRRITPPKILIIRA